MTAGSQSESGGGVMSWAAQRYSDISPVTLQVGGALSSTLYCQQVEGLAQAESFLVEIFRCKLCQFTCGLKAAIGSHLLLRHHSPPLTCLTGPQVSQQGAEPEPPYRLSLDGESKQSEEDEDFLLYDMLGGMSPPTCDISTEEGLQVAHTCEVSSLFEEPFPLKVAPLPRPAAPPSAEDQSAQSAHLRTLGLCRISSVRPPPAEAPPPGRRPCPRCPLTLASRRLLDVHVGSHGAAGGFGCSWEALEPHCRRRCRRGRRRRSRTGGATAAQDADWPSDTWRDELSEPQDPEGAELPDRSSPIGRPLNLPGPTANQKAACEASRSRLSSSSQSGSSQVVSPIRNKEQTSLTCSLCHRTLSSKLTLRRHLGVHGEDRPFSCPHCPYSSRLKASLRQHLRTHTGEKPFRCAECPYASIDRSSLLRHSRTHSQVKPYRCQLCGYSSIQKKSLDLHARRHHTGEAFPCQQCEYSSPDRQLLLKHLRRRHAPSLLPAI